MFNRAGLTPFAMALLMLFHTTMAYAIDDFHGPIGRAGDGQLVLLVSHEQWAFVVSSNARITVDGQKATLADVTDGHMATVTASYDGEQWIAESIAAHAIE